MKFLVKVKHWFLCRIFEDYPGQPQLLTTIENSFKEWQTAKNQFNYIDPELIDYMIYRLNAAEKHYTAMLYQARSEGLRAWPDSLRGEKREISRASGV